MRLKSELYKKEQEEIVKKIVKILDLENKTEYTLYELDKNEEIQKQIGNEKSKTIQKRKHYCSWTDLL